VQRGKALVDPPRTWLPGKGVLVWCEGVLVWCEAVLVWLVGACMVWGRVCWCCEAVLVLLVGARMV